MKQKPSTKPKEIKEKVQPKPKQQIKRTLDRSVQIVLYVVAFGVMTVGLFWLVSDRGETTSTAAQGVPTIESTVTATQEITGNWVTVGDYSFSFPQKVPGERDPVNIAGWLSDSPNEIVDMRRNQIVSIDMYTGETHEFSPKFGDDIGIGKVSILNDNQVGFATYDYKTKEHLLWVNDLSQTTTPVLSGNVDIIVPNNENLWVFDSEFQRGRVLQGRKEIRQATINASSVLMPLSVLELYDPESDSIYTETVSLQSASSPATSWTAIYNRGHFNLVDLRTGESHPIELDDPKQWVDYAVWSPDGQKLALLVTEGDLPLPYEKLFVLDVAKLELREIETDFQYVQDVTWAPDSENLLIVAITGKFYSEEKGYTHNTSRLFFINIISGKIELIDIIPQHSSMGFQWGVSWSSDGHKIAISVRFPYPHLTQLYRIDVEKVEQ